MLFEGGLRFVKNVKNSRQPLIFFTGRTEVKWNLIKYSVETREEWGAEGEI